MFCPHCGTQVSERSKVCVKCGVGLSNINQRNGMLRPPKTWLVESILATFFCCLPFGVVGIVYAASVSTKFNAGDIDGAIKASQQAGKWTRWSLWIALAGIFIYIVSLLALGTFTKMRFF